MFKGRTSQTHRLNNFLFLISKICILENNEKLNFLIDFNVWTHHVYTTPMNKRITKVKSKSVGNFHFSQFEELHLLKTLDEIHFQDREVNIF